MLYKQDPAQAGEFAIAAIELTLKGEVSTDDFMINFALANYKNIVERDAIKYEKKCEAKRKARIEDMELDKIAAMLNSGATQKVIADTLGVPTTTINSRVKVIRIDYPELLNKNTKNTKNTTDDNDNDNENDNVNDNDNDNVNDNDKYVSSYSTNTISIGGASPTGTKQFRF